MREACLVDGGDTARVGQQGEGAQGSIPQDQQSQRHGAG